LVCNIVCEIRKLQGFEIDEHLNCLSLSRTYIFAYMTVYCILTDVLGFTQSIQGNARMVPPIRPGLLLFRSFPVHYSLIILSFNPRYSELLQVYKLTVNKQIVLKGLQNCLLRNYYQLIIGRICSVYGISFTNEI
jgi:hypothetical protein